MKEENHEDNFVMRLHATVAQASSLLERHGCEAVTMPDTFLNGMMPESVDAAFEELFQWVETPSLPVSVARGFRFVWKVLENNWKGRLYIISRCFKSGDAENASEFCQLDVAMFLGDGNLAIAKTLSAKLIELIVADSGSISGKLIRHPYLSPCASVSVQQKVSADEISVGVYGIVRPELLERFGVNPDLMVPMYLSFNLDALTRSRNSNGVG